MNKMYTVIGNVKSRTLRVLWALEELGLDYEHRPSNPRDPAVVALNPSGKVPVLLVEGEPLTDSTAIVTYLADKHEDLTFQAGTLQRAKQDAFTQRILDEIDAVLWTAARHSFVLPEDQRVPDIKPSLRWEFERSIERLSGDLFGNAFLMGDRFTVPDIMLAHCLGWAITAKFPVEPDNLRNYLDRLRARPAFQRALSA